MAPARTPPRLPVLVTSIVVALAATAVRPVPQAAAQQAPPVPLTAPLVYVTDSAQSAQAALTRNDGDGDGDGESVLVRHRSLSDPVWSPTRAHVAYIRFVAAEDRSEVRVVGADGSGDRAVADGTDVAWAPDGTRLAVTVVGEGLFTMRPDGTDRRQLTTVDDHVADRVPRWSPDGRWIAFLRTDTLAGIARPRLHVVDVERGGVRALTGPDEAVEDPTWSPDGAWVAVHVRTGQDEGGNFVGHVVKLRRDGGERVVLTDERPAFDPAWSPDGEQIALAVDVVAGGGRDLDLFLVRADGSDLRRILDVDRNVDGPAWSPDASAIAFTGISCCASGGGGPRQIWDVFAVARDGHGLRQLTDDGLSMDHDFPPPAPRAATLRLAGPTRIATAAAIALARLDAGEDTAPAVLLANATTFPDALAGSALAGHVEAPDATVDAPLLLSYADELPERTAQVLRELSARRVVILGGEAAISAGVEEELAAEYDVVRIAGADRYATAAQAARALVRNAGGLGTVDGRTTVVVASGQRFPDALAAGPLGYAAAVPILLTASDRLPDVTAAAIRDLGPQQALVVGGTAAVSEDVAAAIRDLGATVTRVAGPTRTATAARLADFAITQGVLDPDQAALARGDAFADALAGGPHAGERRAPILLAADPQTLSQQTADLLRAYCEPLGVVMAYGGDAAVRPDTLAGAARAATCGA